ncbi:non-specific serine,threonine protein kinase [Sarracenia purpurea var. burkii]
MKIEAGSHVSLSDVNDGVAKAYKTQVDNQARELFLPFRAFCTRKDIKCNEIIIEDMDIAKVICDYVKINLIETLVVGAASRNSFVKRFKASDIPTSLSKGAPEFCSVYVISKGKISSVRSASIPVPNPPPRPVQYYSSPAPTPTPAPPDARPMQNNAPRGSLPLP